MSRKGGSHEREGCNQDTPGDRCGQTLDLPVARSRKKRGIDTMAEAYATPISSSTEAARTGQGFGGVQPILSVRHIEKVYGTKDSITHALAGVSFDVVPGAFIGIMGPSGSG